MFNQRILAAVAILSSSFMGFQSAHAVDCTQGFNALYVGAYGDAISVADKYSFTDNGPAVTLNGNGNKTLFGGGLFAGLGGVVNCNWYLGGEAFGQTNTKPSTVSLISGTNNWTLVHSGSDYSWGAQARGGYFINGGTLAFLSMGFIATHYNFTVTDVVGRTVATINNTSYAPLPGIGIEAAITQNLHLRTAYTYAWYKNSSASNGDLNSSITPQRGQFSLGLSYGFFC